MSGHEDDRVIAHRAYATAKRRLEEAAEQISIAGAATMHAHGVPDHLAPSLVALGMLDRANGWQPGACSHQEIVAHTIGAALSAAVNVMREVQVVEALADSTALAGAVVQAAETLARESGVPMSEALARTIDERMGDDAGKLWRTISGNGEPS